MCPDDLPGDSDDLVIRARPAHRIPVVAHLLAGRTAAPAVSVLRCTAAALVALLVFLGVAELVAVPVGPAAAPTLAIGEVAIAHTPNPVKDFAIAHFGEHDKAVLVIGIYLVLALVAVAVGAATGTLRSRPPAFAALAVLGAVAALSAATRPTGGPLDAMPSMAGAAAAAAAFALLTPRWPAGSASAADGDTSERPGDTSRRPGAGAGVAASPAGVPPAGGSGTRPALSRRRFLTSGAALAGMGTAALVAGRSALQSAADAVSSRAAVRLPRPALRGRVVAGTDVGVAGVPPYITPNADFYRVDTALVVPKLRTEGYTLRLHGLVDRPVTWTYQELLRMPLAEQTMTLVCVSDPVGGPYLGNARWLGVPLGPLLRDSGVHPAANQLFMTSADGMTIGADLRAAMDGRPALLAVGMNGEPLPFEHGFPLRAVIPGFYGYASACKWLVDLEVTTYGAKQAYWVQRGYAQRAPIKLESRIDTPASFAQLRRGPVIVAGSAWLPGVGIRDVQVAVDGGPWQDAALAAVDSVDTWRQWRWRWSATPGSHSIAVRAVDARGRIQTAGRAGVFPDGASGHQSVVVTVA